MNSLGGEHAPVPVPALRHAQLVSPASVFFEAHGAGNNKKNAYSNEPVYFDEPIKWVHDSVSLTRLCESAFKAPTQELLQFSQRKAVAGNANSVANLPDATRKIYGYFGSDRSKPRLDGLAPTEGCLMPQGNLMSNPRALDPNFALDFPCQPNGICLRFINASGTIRVSRAVFMRMLVAQRSPTSMSWSAHRARMLPPVMSVTTLQKGLNARPDMNLGSFIDEGLIRYSTQHRPPGELNKDVLEVGHEISGCGEMDVETRGNIEYQMEMHNVSAVVYIRLNKSTTNVSLSGFEGIAVDMYVEYTGTEAAIAMRPAEALSIPSGVEAVSRYLGVSSARSSFFDKSEFRPSYEMWPFDVIEQAEASKRAEALAEHLVIDTKNGYVFFRDQPLMFRTHDNVHYAAFILCDDARARLPLCYFVRRSPDELKRLRNAAQVPLRLHMFNKMDKTNAIVVKCLAPKTTRESMERLAVYFGTPLMSYKIVAPVTGEAELMLDMLTQLGAEIIVKSAPLPDPLASHEPDVPIEVPAQISAPPSTVPAIVAPMPAPMTAVSPDVVDDSGDSTKDMELVDSGSLSNTADSLVDAMANVVHVPLSAPAPVAEPVTIIPAEIVPNPPSPRQQTTDQVAGPLSRPSMLNAPVHLDELLSILEKRKQVIMEPSRLPKVTDVPIVAAPRKSIVPLTASGPRQAFPVPTRFVESAASISTLPPTPPRPLAASATATLPLAATATAQKSNGGSAKRKRAESETATSSKRRRPNTDATKRPETSAPKAKPFVLPPPPTQSNLPPLPANISRIPAAVDPARQAPVNAPPPPPPPPPPRAPNFFVNTFGDDGSTNAFDFVMGESASLFPFDSSASPSSLPPPAMDSTDPMEDPLTMPKHSAVDFHWETNQAHAYFEPAGTGDDFDNMTLDPNTANNNMWDDM